MTKNKIKYYEFDYVNEYLNKLIMISKDLLNLKKLKIYYYMDYQKKIIFI